MHDFSGVSLFTIPTVAIKFGKGIAMHYPMEQYRFYFQIGRKSKIDSHADWKQVSEIVEHSDCLAQPVDKEDLQSAWLTLKDMTFASVIEVVDGYAISTNRGVDILKYIAIKKFDETNAVHRKIAEISKISMIR